MNLDQFGELLQDYQAKVAHAGHHDARRQLFFGFAQSAFGVELTTWQVEAKVYGGWIDAILGNLVFEFKSDLAREMDDAHSELKRYLRQLHQSHPNTLYTAVVTDGLKFHVYRPDYVNGDVSGLEELRSFSLSADQPKRDALADSYYQLDALLAGFHTDKVPPTVQLIVASLGSGSTVFLSASAELNNLYLKTKDESPVQVRFRQWSRYLGVVLGEAPESKDLFIRHTYLATLNKLVAYLTLDPDHPPTTPEELEGVLNGSLFSDRGIHNFIEDDLFTWFLTTPTIHAAGLSFLKRLMGTLRRFDFRQVSQDILKELYQEVVGRDARHDIGEYYTPDWLAELTLREGVDLPNRPTISVLDPACGSGTFLFISIRLVMEALKDQGWQSSDILRHVLNNLQGVDVHPVAVITARTNYLLALSDLLSGPRPAIAIPVYLANAVVPPERQTASQVVKTRRGRKRAEATARLESEAVLPWQPGEGNLTFEYPASLMAHPQLLDRLVNAMRDHLQMLDPGATDKEIETAVEAYGAYVHNAIQQATVSLTDEAHGYLRNMFRQVAQMHCQEKDGIWTFLLKNAPRPVFLQDRQFDVVVGNPPWLSLRYFKGAGYAQQVKRLALEDYNLRIPNKMD